MAKKNKKNKFSLKDQALLAGYDDPYRYLEDYNKGLTPRVGMDELTTTDPEFMSEDEYKRIESEYSVLMEGKAWNPQWEDPARAGQSVYATPDVSIFSELTPDNDDYDNDWVMDSTVAALSADDQPVPSRYLEDEYTVPEASIIDPLIPDDDDEYYGSSIRDEWSEYSSSGGRAHGMEIPELMSYTEEKERSHPMPMSMRKVLGSRPKPPGRRRR